MIKIYVEKPFTFKDADGNKALFEKGFHEVKNTVSEHWFVKENSVLASDVKEPQGNDEIKVLQDQVKTKDDEIKVLQDQVGELTKSLEEVKKDAKKQKPSDNKPGAE